MLPSLLLLLLRWELRAQGADIATGAVIDKKSNPKFDFSMRRNETSSATLMNIFSLSTEN